MRKRTELVLEEKCCKWARSKGLAALKLENNRHRGVPDRLFVQSGGLVLFVEFKSPDGLGVVSIEQKFWAEYLGLSHVIINSEKEFKSKIVEFFNL